MESISHHATKKFALAIVKLGNINLVNDVMNAVHAIDYMIDQVSNEEFIKQTQSRLHADTNTYTRVLKIII